MAKLKKQHKACQGCGDHFTTYKNYDYCQDCAVNGNRYIVRNSSCSECDGSGWIKFPGQPKRPCKLCYLTKKTMTTAEKPAEKFWDQVDQISQEKIYQLFTQIIPFQNIPLIKEPWKFEDKQQKLTGLFLLRDVDYRTLLDDMKNQYYEVEHRPDAEYLAEEVALWYCRLVMKALIGDLSKYSPYDPSYFENLIEK